MNWIKKKKVQDPAWINSKKWSALLLCGENGSLVCFPSWQPRQIWLGEALLQLTFKDPVDTRLLMVVKLAWARRRCQVRRGAEEEEDTWVWWAWPTGDETLGEKPGIHPDPCREISEDAVHGSCGISRNARKLARTPKVIKKKKVSLN